MQWKGLAPAFPWITGRFAVALVIIALLVALSVFAPWTLAVAIAAAAATFVLLLADIAWGPRGKLVDVRREPVGHLALRSPAKLGYVVTNRSNTHIRVRIVDTPIDAFDLGEKAVEGAVGGGKRRTLERPVMPRLRGPFQLGSLFVTVRNPIGFIDRRWW